MKKMIKPFVLPLGVLLMAAIAFVSCDKFFPEPDQTDPPIMLDHFSVSDCLQEPLSIDDTVFVNATENGGLVLTSQPALNCCDDNFRQTTVVTGNNITINITLDHSFCQCICNRRLTASLLNLMPGEQYTIRLKIDGYEYHSCTVLYTSDLNTYFVL